MKKFKFSAQNQPHRCKRNRFYNYPGEKPEGIIGNAFRTAAEGICNRFRKWGTDFNHWQQPQKPLVSSHDPQITWIGHASFLIQLGHFNILMDPIFGDASFFFPRVTAPGIVLDALPPIDVVMISHNHMDHMDAHALYALKKQHPGVAFLVPHGDRAWFIKRGFSNVHEYMWWEQHILKSPKINIKKTDSITQELVCTFLPAHHWSQRMPFDRNKSLWGSWMIEFNGFTIYFAGDTAYGKHFQAIGAEFPFIDIALMPIAPCEPDERMRKTHVSAQEAGQGFLDLGARHFIPMHWGTYFFGTDTYDGPIKRLQAWWHQSILQLKEAQLHLLKIGQRSTFAWRSDIHEVEQKIEKQKPL